MYNCYILKYDDRLCKYRLNYKLSNIPPLLGKAYVGEACRTFIVQSGGGGDAGGKGGCGGEGGCEGRACGREGGGCMTGPL